MSDALPGVELGTYYVSITTSERTLFAQLSSAGVTAASAAAASAGSTYAKKFTSTATSQINSLLARYGPIALTGLVLKQGLDQLLQVDTAENQLKSLGHTGEETGVIMNSAFGAVRNTIFSVGDAATVAAAAVSAGVQAGKPLTDYLSLVADTATAAHAPLQTIGELFNRIQSQGILQAREINELQADGVPIFAALRKEYGLTGTALTNFVAKGGVDAQQFLEVIKKNFGGDAVKAGDSIQGAFSKVEETVANIGQDLLGGNATQVPKFLEQVDTDLQPIATVATVVGQALGVVVNVFGAIPGPVLAAAASMLVVSKVGPLVKSGFETAALQGMYFSESIKTGAEEAELAGARFPFFTAGLTGITTAARAGGSALLGMFGGPVGLAVGAGIAILTTALGQWSAATEQQQADVENLTDSLDANTASVTAQTRSDIFSDLTSDSNGNAIKAVEALGLSTKDYLDAIEQGGPKLAKFKQEINDVAQAQTAAQASSAGGARGASSAIYGGNGADLANTRNAATALAGLKDETTLLGTSQETARERIAAGAVSITDESNAAKIASGSTKTFTQTVDGAFTAVSNLGKQNSAIQALGASLKQNGDTFSDTTAKGIANSTALQQTLDALATNAGKDGDAYAIAVIGLMNQLRAEGVNTSGVLAAVDSSLAKISGTKWSVYLDGSESVAEALKVAKANLLAAESAVALQVGTKRVTGGASPTQIAELQSVVSQLEALQSSQSSAGKQLAAGAASAAKSAGSAAKSATNYKQDIVAATQEFLDPTKEATAAAAMVKAVNAAYAAHAISAAQKAELLAQEKSDNTQLSAILKQQTSIATQLDAANTALSNAQQAENDYQSQIADGYKALGDITKLATDDANAFITYQRIGNTIYGSTQASSSAASVVSALKNQVQQAEEFQAAYAQLTKLGLNSGSLQDLVTGFASSGDASVAQGLLAGGGAAVDQVNSLEAQLNALGTSTAATASQAFYGVGVSAAQGLVQGLEAQNTQLTKAYDALADGLLAEVKKELGIHSPSTKMAYLAEMASLGWNQNLHFDSVQDQFEAAGGFDKIAAAQPIFIQQTNHYAYSKTEAEAVNDGLDLARTVFHG